jgi:ABC-2 type transport system ATP-binding protein
MQSQKGKRDIIMVSIENLSKSYGSKIVLENINLNFLNGKVYGIVGENGAGKQPYLTVLLD